MLSKVENVEYKALDFRGEISRNGRRRNGIPVIWGKKNA